RLGRMRRGGRRWSSLLICSPREKRSRRRWRGCIKFGHTDRYPDYSGLRCPAQKDQSPLVPIALLTAVAFVFRIIGNIIDETVTAIVVIVVIVVFVFVLVVFVLIVFIPDLVVASRVAGVLVRGDGIVITELA